MNEKDQHDKANDVGKGHIMQDFVGLVKEFGFPGRDPGKTGQWEAVEEFSVGW